ncbi:MAG: nucleotidyl transferase AbiEii/AbiGii toxin family protein [Candidatus Omnitrophica bacterium]|nr:nucleotidyl transferase AbiEii/AbiGii toxin family protein [Candidatus Omnitrophota bacterium]
MRLFREVLSKRQTEILPHLFFLKEERFYLAGGTALALQIKHRTSIDFDFYTEAEFLPEDIIELFQKETKEITEIQTGRGTLISRIKRVEVSLFHYPYLLLEPFVESKNLNLASLKDIAAMKLIAIIQRGTKRDFFDLYFLIRNFGLEKIIELTQKKYPPFNPYLALQALTYFEDAEKEDLNERKIIFFKPVSWNKVKESFIKEVRVYKKKLE